MTTHRTAVHFGVLALLALSAPASAAGLNDYSCKLTSAHPRPVVLVHGRGGDVQGFQTLIGALGAAGYCVFGTNYGQVGGQGPNGLDHLTVSAAEIRDFVNEVLAKTGARQVDVIGHSAGTGVLDNFIRRKAARPSRIAWSRSAGCITRTRTSERADSPIPTCSCRT